MCDFSFTLDDWKRSRYDDEELNMNNFDFFDQGMAMPSTTGSGLTGIFTNSSWQFKMSGLYQLPYGIDISAFFQAREGSPQPLRSQFKLHDFDNFGYQMGNAGDTRLPAFWMLNLGLEKTLKGTSNDRTMVIWH